MASPYIGRFAPSPTGPLHAGSLVAALASWLDARAHGGQWLIRIEDVDQPRCVPGATDLILQQLSQCGLHSDGPVLVQSQREDAYRRALQHLIDQGWAYPCACTRADIARAQAELGWHKSRHSDLVYPGTCRPSRGGLQGRRGRAWRLQVPTDPAANLTPWTWHDRCRGTQTQDLAQSVGDFVIKRADGWWAYQLAVVVDDAEQGITDIVRGQDLMDNTPRQQWLQHCLGAPTPRYLHTPLVMGLNGEKLSKQNGAQALDLEDPIKAICAALTTLGLATPDTTPRLHSLPEVLAQAVQAWRDSPFMRPAR